MRYQRAVFAAGIAVGFIAGSKAGRKPYDMMAKSARKAVQSPPAQRTFKAASDKATNMKKAAAAKVGDLCKSATSGVSKAIGSGARKARDKARDTARRPARHRVASMNTPTVDTPSMNGNGHTAHDYHD
ncbi:MAG TPA: hypothetical protein VMG38_24910 [Trebonia sp.]|nr:hypothetical protein [Trebonia sp.]